MANENGKLVRKYRGLLKRTLRNWWISLIVVLLCVALGVGYSLEVRPERYVATFDLYVNADETVADPAYAAKVYAKLADTTSFCEKTIKAAGIGNAVSAEELQKTLCVCSNGQKVTVSLSASNKNYAEVLGKAMAEKLIEEGSTLVLGTKATVLTAVEASTSLRGPVCWGVLGLIVGVVLGLFIGMVFAVIGDTLGSFTWLKSAYPEVPVLCVAHPSAEAEKKEKKKHEKDIDEEEGKDEKQIKLGKELRATDLAPLSRILPFCFPEHEGCIVLGITGFSENEDKSRAAVDIASALAQTGHKVVLVDGDMKNGLVAKALHRSAAPGLSDLIIGTSSNVLRRGIMHENLIVVTRGTTPPDEKVLLDSGIYGRILETLSSEANYLILNLPVPDEKLVLTGVDGVLPVVNRSESRRSEIIRALNFLAEKGAYVPGFVAVDDRTDY